MRVFCGHREMHLKRRWLRLPPGTGQPSGRFGVEAMPDFVLFLYAGAVGFIVAGLAATAYRIVTSRPVRFGASGSGLLSVVAAFVFGLVLGPVIIVNRAFASVRAGEVPSSWAAAGILVAALWSCCLGIAILAVAESLRNSLA
jgi:hypothetical protein